jgi:hypothetical protein
MTEESKLMYLAGPVTNCNEKQRTEWRKAIRSRLAKLGHKWIDPSEHEDWTPLREMVEIDRSDVVIANLWRESVGTVIGIVQARRKGKPVILIDTNFLENSALRHLVGKDFIVRGIEEAINLLPQVVEQINKVVLVRKSSGATEPFASSKLHDSLNAVCARAHVEDAILPDLLANAVHRSVMKAERNGEISADRIKELVFEALGDIATDNNLYEEELNERATLLRCAWEDYERVKKDQRWALEHMDELDQELKSAKEKIASIGAENDSYQSEIEDLRRSLRKLERQAKAGTAVETGSDEIADELGKDYGNYFPSLKFSDSALVWILSCDKTIRRILEGRFRVMNQERPDGKHEVPGTSPLVWQQDAGHGLRIYFRQEHENRTAVVMLGTKGTQDSDYSKLRKI